MSLKPCRECGNQVSDQAKTCPSCGIGNPVAKKQQSKIVRYGGAFIFLVISSTLFLGALKNSPPNPQITSSSPDRRAQAQATVAALKQLARDPDSLKIEKLLISDDGKIQCIQYQAKNGFGGTNREFIVMINNETSKSLSDWTSNCLETFADYSAYVW